MNERGAGGISRRGFIRGAMAAGAGAALGGTGLARSLWAAGEAAPKPAAKARSVIQIWMWGGPAHLDTFDPKPKAGSDYTGPFDSPIATNADGVTICQLLPELAKVADKYSIIRSMTHGINGHETAAYMVQTGREPGGRIVYPTVGAVVSSFKGLRAGYKGLIPPYIVLTRPQGRFSEAGFLGTKYMPFATGGDPARTPFAVEGVVAAGITPERQRARRDLAAGLDTLGGAMRDDAQVAAARAAREQAYGLILGDAGKVFDLTQEKQELRDRYGRSTFGQSCLAARRLVEQGVPYVTINYPGWDTHKQHFQTMRRMLPDLDRGMATLLADLSDRGLLDSTIVWWTGEFGRTPRVQWEPPWNGGRGHYGKAFCSVLAGGGFRGGRVVGESDARGEEVKDRPVWPRDVIAGVYELLGIDGEATLPHPLGLPTRVMEPAGEGVKSGGRLKEIL
ncbi:MAG: hypothetical protein BIFFINMI_01444 [Phycisphaerae bacterium]|nr:hypothetical protein [Phycisphaerae bacterium]